MRVVSLKNNSYQEWKSIGKKKGSAPDMCASSHFATSPCGSDEHSLMWFQSMDCDCTTVFHSVLCYAGVPRVAKIPVKQTEGMCASPFLQYAPANLLDMVECDFQAMDCDCATVFHFRICYARVPRATTLSCRTRPALYELMMCGRHCLAGHDQRDAELYELMMCGRAMESSMWFRLAPKVWKAVRVTVDC
jgi:hypothetical protein